MHKCCGGVVKCYNIFALRINIIISGDYCLNRTLNFFKSRKVLNISFLFIIFFILIFPLTKINKAKTSPTENRTLAASAKLFNNKKLNTKFGTDFETWLGDRFRYREKLLNHYVKLNALLLGRIENNKAFLGSDGWLFYKAEHSINNFQNKNLFTDSQLEKIKANILTRKELLEKQGIHYYILIAPDKNRIYGEYYYPEIKKVAPKGRAEELISFLSDCDLNIVYPLTKMLDAKSDGTIYYRLDTHWNNYGAFVGYSELMNEIKADHPNLKSLTLSDFNIKTRPEKGGDLLNMLNVPVAKLKLKNNSILQLHPQTPYSYKYIKNKGREGVKTRNDSPLNNLRVFVLRDSFTTAMEPYISETFQESEFVWTHNFNSQYENILKYKPDIVIHEMVERYAHTLLVDTPPIKGEK